MKNQSASKEVLTQIDPTTRSQYLRHLQINISAIDPTANGRLIAEAAQMEIEDINNRGKKPGNRSFLDMLLGR